MAKHALHVTVWVCWENAFNALNSCGVVNTTTTAARWCEKLWLLTRIYCNILFSLFYTKFFRFRTFFAFSDFYLIFCFRVNKLFLGTWRDTAIFAAVLLVFTAFFTKIVLVTNNNKIHILEVRKENNFIKNSGFEMSLSAKTCTMVFET